MICRLWSITPCPLMEIQLWKWQAGCKIFLSPLCTSGFPLLYVDGLVQERHSSIPKALKLRPLIYCWLNMLNCFKDHKRCIHISYHILDCIQQKETKFTTEQQYMLSVLYCQYHVCWYHGDLRSQGISRHCIHQTSWNIYLFLASKLQKS